MWLRSDLCSFGSEAADGETERLARIRGNSGGRAALIIADRWRWCRCCFRLSRRAAEQLANARPPRFFIRHQLREFGPRCRVCKRTRRRANLIEKRHQIPEVFI